MRSSGLLCLLAVIGSPVMPAAAQAPAKKAVSAAGGGVPAAMSVIKEADLKKDLYAMASLDMRGREAGTLDELRASMWVADELRKIGVKPAGTDGSYFQWWNMRRTRISMISSSAKIGARTLALWTDIVPTGNASEASGLTIWGGDGSDTTINIRGKVVIGLVTKPTRAVAVDGTNSYEYRYATSAIQASSAHFQQRGAAAIILVTDSISDIGFQGYAAIRARGAYDVPGGVPRNGTPAPNANAGRGGNAASGAGGAGGAGGRAGAAGGAGAGGRGGGRGNQEPNAPVFLVRSSMLNTLRNGGETAEFKVRMESFDAPSVNIVGKIAGTDPKLKDEYVLYSSHQDHDGVRYDIKGDSTWSGADDNGSVSVALLAIARAFVKQPSKRSVLFVYHGAEERGLLGSRWHAAHPVVPLASIVAVLNGDMIGRNNSDSASLMGIQPPHRNSTELVEMALKANALTGKFTLDSTWDRPTHPEGWYFRSDHVPYARLNVPAVEYSTNLHPDYHTPRDKPENINYPKLTRMTQWMYMTGWLVANNPKRPAIDPGFALER
ncbi:MAG: M28 family peptidase [Gemmatimonas sp.]